MSHFRLTKSGIGPSIGFVAASVVCVVMLCSLALAGWLLDRVHLAALLPSMPTMKANTAICFIALGLDLAARRKAPATRRVLGLGSLLAASIAGATLIEYLTGVDLHIDEALLSDRATAPGDHPGRMAVATAVAILLLAAAPLVAARVAGSARSLPALLALAIGYVSSIGLMFGADWGRDLGYSFSTVSLPTAACIVLLSAAALSLAPPRGLRLDASGTGSASSKFLRGALPALTLLPAAVFWVQHLAHRRGWWGDAVGLVLGISALVGLLLALAIRAARWIGRLEFSLRANRELLEQHVVERTAELSRTAARLRTSREQLANVVDSALDAVINIDQAGRIVGWNRQAVTMFGWSAPEAMARPLHELIIPTQHRDAHLRGMAHYRATGEGPVLNRRVELTALCRDGAQFPVELAISPIRSPDGIEFSAFLRDISARHAAEEERRSLETQVRESQKMEAIGTLAGGIAHDFNNILAAMLGNVALARDDVGAASPAQPSLLQIQKSAVRARDLVQKILAFSRRQEQQLAPLTLRPLIEETRALMRPVLPAGVTLDMQLADEPLWVLADPTQLQQVLMNLCTNAWHALDGNTGRIEVGLDTLAPTASVPRPLGLGPGRYAHLWVRDDGRGMDAATRSRIFEPFFTTKPVGQGTGLGLSVVHGIVTAHGGAIAVDSVPGQGTDVHVYLPLRGPGVGSGAPDSPPAAAPAGQGQHVLYVDDDEVMVELVGRVLERAGYRSTMCQDAQQALALVSERPQAFDLVVTDFNMPGLSGIDLARALAGLRPDLPVVISSGYITEALQADAKRDGVRALLRKENTFDELPALVHRVLSAAAPPH